MKVVTVPTADSFTASRGYLGTTVAAHANSLSIYEAQSLEDCGFPDRAGKPVSAYVVWQAYEQRIVARSRDNQVYGTVDEGAVKMYELQREADRLKLLYETSLLNARREMEAF
jgi:hypothetical protein